MKHSILIALTSVILVFAGCGGGPGGRTAAEADTIPLPADTIKRFMSGNYVVSEVTFRDGKREGLTKTFYQSGRLQRTYWYEKGLRQDTSNWYFEEGQVFQTTPFLNDTIHGIRKQYYRTGEIKARIGFTMGYRNDFFEEYTRDGKLVRNYPELVVRTEDSYKANGVYRIILELTDKQTKVNYLRGDFTNGVYDTTKVKKIRTVGNTGYLDLKKTGSPTETQAGVIAAVLTDFGNRMLIYKKIDLPYNDLK
jgi:antitoxin component YwqK of YwqJK toxin-antitoxin module